MPRQNAFPLRIMEVDLTQQASRAVEIAPEVHRKFIGGSTLAAHLLLGRLTADLDPIGPEALLVLATGPLTGTRGPAVGRAVICAKSPATGAWGESNIGGHIGPQLRAAGIDVLVVAGCSREPVYLWIQEGSIEFRPADHLWGLEDTYRTQLKIKEEVGSASAHVACIGPAGEAGLPTAVILCDHGRVAGRTGMGTVMGSKRLKAIAVYGRAPMPLVAEAPFDALRSQINKEMRNDVVTAGLRDFGTAGASDMFDYFGLMPKRYYSSGHLDGADLVSGTSMSETILSGVSTCHGCVIACGRRVRLPGASERKGPEYETIVGFGPNLGITDLVAITRLGDLCDRYGMDTISVSNTIGLAFLLYERGHLDEQECGGSLRWGDVEAAERLVHLTASGEGFGGLLSQGVRSLADHCGVDELAVQVKGLEAPYHDPRGASGVALTYATSPRGACHNQSHYYMVEIGQTLEEIGVERYDRQAGPEKAGNVARHQDWLTVQNALVQCIFANVSPSVVCEFLNHATGWEYTLEELLVAGERGWTLKRMINHRLGFTAHDDLLPGHLLAQLKEGGAAGFELPFEEMLAAYYRVRGWDPETGRPSEPLLDRVGLREF